jgi:hypothetical protein
MTVAKAVNPKTDVPCEVPSLSLESLPLITIIARWFVQLGLGDLQFFLLGCDACVNWLCGWPLLLTSVTR